MKQKRPFWNRPAKAASAKPRSRAEIQDDYNRACNEAGDIQYKLVFMSQRLEWLTKFRGALNEELRALEEAEVAKASAELPTAPPPAEERH